MSRYNLFLENCAYAMFRLSLRKANDPTTSEPEAEKMKIPKPDGKLMGVSQNQGYCFGGPNNKDYNILGSILGSMLGSILGSILSPTWTPKVCKIKVFMAIIMGFGLLFYILLGFR